MPAEVLEVTKKFMRDPVRILVKKEELTLEGIKQFYINVEREVCVFLFQNGMEAFSPKHPAGTAGARPGWFSSCGHVSTGTPGKENKGPGLKTRQRGDLFLNVQCLLSQGPVSHDSMVPNVSAPSCDVVEHGFAFLSPGVEAGHPV